VTQLTVMEIHGFNVKDKGDGTVGRLTPFIRVAGFLVDEDEGDYGFFNIWMVRLFKTWLKRRAIHRLAIAIAKADIIITHSNGANFFTQAADMLDPKYNNTKIVVHISPALNSNTKVPGCVKAQLVLHTPHDGWVKLSSYIPLHPWGRMGARGYTGRDNRVTSVENDLVKGHSDWFIEKHVRKTWACCHSFIKEYAL